PGDFAEAGLKSFCGALWLKKEFVIDNNLLDSDWKVWLVTITDSDTVYINGIEIGNTGYRYPPRKYSIPHGVLQKGENTIIIRVICNNGEGGVTIEKDFRVFSGSESVELAGEWDYRVGAKVTSACPEQFFFQRQPIGNYNAMIAPVLKFPLKGVIWYQGESNEQNPHEYAALFQAMIKDWRGKNKNEALPFLFVQLPIWKEETDNNENDSWALLREAQAAALSLPHTGMAAALELGEWNDLNPLNKKDVGIRLFLAADKVVFNCENTSPGPQVRAWEKRQDKLYILFDNCGSGLKSACGKTFVSLIDGDEMQRVPAEIEGSDLISIDISTAKNVKKVLYAWAINPKDRQLYNSDGLPAIPFKIEID
ncbi:MAG: sialate O-acetylesterase, partial [Treponema sp.]|nr:sialate O-acetylesterase [Treponema sp.]